MQGFSLFLLILLILSNFLVFLPAQQAWRLRIMAGVVGFGALKARCRIAVAAPEKTGIVHSYIPACGAPAFFSLARVLGRAYLDCEQLRNQIRINALRRIYAKRRQILL